MTHPLPRPVVRLAARVLVPLVTGAALLGATGAAEAATTLHRGSTGSSVTTLQRYLDKNARAGYAGASHGCVNLRDYAGVRWLNGQVHIGTKVVVYR